MTLHREINYEKYDASGKDGDINLLRGLNDAVDALRKKGQGVAGAFYWHGWNNSDTYSFWGEGYRGRPEVERILGELSFSGFRNENETGETGDLGCQPLQASCRVTADCCGGDAGKVCA